MTPRQITPRYSVSPQIEPTDLPAIAAAGFTKVICNRPDSEVPAELQSEAIRIAAEAAGLSFEKLELTHQTMTPENVARQAEMIEHSDGPVFAYCASGTRCSVVWALGQAGQVPVDQILAATAQAGYNLENLRPALEQAASQA